MHKVTIKRSESGVFKDFQIQLSENQEKLNQFINLPFNKEAFIDQMKLKSDQFDQSKRDTLVDCLNRQYGDDAIAISGRLELLRKDSTFTVTTGHQLSIFTGPLFFVYKILHVIKLAENLNQLYPEHSFLPVFWMASEDHDFEEIKSVHLFNNTMTWDSSQTGAVGRFSMEGMDALKEEFHSFFDRFPEAEIHRLLQSYKGETLGQATRKFVAELFQDYPLIIIDGDDPVLKQSFRTIMKKELISSFSYQEVNKTNQLLNEQGIPLQVNPREINLFYLDKDSRIRVEKSDREFTLSLDGKKHSLDEVLEILDEFPEHFSPNVILRPVYQEHVLPNLCYTGGLGEIQYWLQLKGVFDQAGIPFPLIQIRQSLIWVDKTSAKRMKNFNITPQELFLSRDLLIKNHIDEQTDQHDLSEMKHRRDELRNTLLELIDHEPSLEGTIKAEWRKIEKSIESIENKLTKAHKNKHETEINQIIALKDKLFPANSWQERSMNFFQLSPDGTYKSILRELHQSIDPFTSDIQILINE